MRLPIQDASGGEVVVLADERREPRRCATTWDGRDGAERAVVRDVHRGTRNRLGESHLWVVDVSRAYARKDGLALARRTRAAPIAHDDIISLGIPAILRSAPPSLQDAIEDLAAGVVPSAVRRGATDSPRGLGHTTKTSIVRERWRTIRGRWNGVRSDRIGGAGASLRRGDTSERHTTVVSSATKAQTWQH